LTRRIRPDVGDETLKMPSSRRDVLATLSALTATSAVDMLPFGQAHATTAGLGMDAGLATLARDIDRAESVRAIKRLQHAWGLYVDAGEWDAATALFTADAELAHGAESFRGAAAIRAYFRRAIGDGAAGLPARTVHTPFLMAPIITLAQDGESAHGRWHAFSMRGALGDKATWGGGIFRCRYVREAGEWKIASQLFFPQLAGPYEGGWNPYTPELPMVPYNYEPADIGRPIPLGPTVPATAPTDAALASLAGRVRALEDETLVRNLQNAYGYYVDFKMWDDVVDLFAHDASVSIEGIGTWRGLDGIRRSFERSGPAGLQYGEVNDHIQFDTVVEVAADGRSARARGIQLGMIGRDNERAWWTLTRFDNTFARAGGKWRFAEMRKAMWMMTDYFKGWAKDWREQPRPSAAFTPRHTKSVPLPSSWRFERKPPVPVPLTGVDLGVARLRLHNAAGADSAENLTGAYGQYLDDSHWDELGSIFAAQGERDSAGGGFIRTPARIASYSRLRYGSYNPHRTFANMHMLTQPVVHVAADGTKAQIRVRLLQTAIVARRPGGKGFARGPMFITGMYEDDIVFEDGAWKIQRADIDHLIYAPYETGWTRVPDNDGAGTSPSFGAAAGEPFDAFNTGDINPAFPRVPHMWFHYRNPVSGRNPPYLMPKYVLPAP
jgi:hypothetical protein